MKTGSAKNAHVGRRYVIRCPRCHSWMGPFLRICEACQATEERIKMLVILNEAHELALRSYARLPRESAYRLKSAILELYNETYRRV